MLKLKAVFVWFCLAMFSVVQVQAKGQAPVSEVVSEVVSLDGLPEYHHPEEALVGYLKNEKAKGKKNRFCIVAYRSFRGAESSEQVYVYWHEGQKLILWEPVKESSPVEDGLIFSRRQWGLKNDVVATDDDIGGSTYLISKPWVQGVLDDCAKRGQKFSIRGAQN